MSGAARNAARSAVAAAALASSQDQASWRAPIRSASVSGPASCSPSSRAPAAVNVRWIAASSVCAVPPSRARRISRLARVAASISNRPARPCGSGGVNVGSFPAPVIAT